VLLDAVAAADGDHGRSRRSHGRQVPVKESLFGAKKPQGEEETGHGGTEPEAHSRDPVTARPYVKEPPA
jgi:hypothetical protein